MAEKELKLPFELNTIGESKRQVPVFREKGYEAHQFIWVKGGSGVFTICDQSFILNEGDGMFMRANVPHSYEGENLWTAWCTFFTHRSLVDYSIGNREFVLFRVPDFLERETVELQRFAWGNSSSLSLSAASYTYITELFNYININRDEGLREKVCEYLYNNYSKPISLQDICDSLNLDKFNLCRQFKKESGKTVMDQLLDIRIIKSKRMLRYTNDSIENVGLNCGFESPSYFCKRFKEKCDISPAIYRKKRYE